ncbi:hypothetical protein QCD85_02310 [Paenibacillus sp. PsM32]|uniref:hypothetical protein n=1 Tax=unclassified Paenibacillus TaxID=185978 RepID=UPI0023651E53|nr:MULTISPECIES: hypothetical protein [unclassified Paenibacillus]MDN4616913.1 hypothetical protein [Paenibacillus sp. PsM32]MDQ1233242.1 heme/copper-type cytochrome/quinol oxidase subunit 2 [Paenibacillus sp. SORGH_AS_0306]MDR6110286.1 heme/copper-type cytochrome/quinol oxidase subunit 2 [Paenibacillus sp. SORGH_AS_0338]WDF49655.1 hypothetical protein PQ460_16805 [Paenibacillus sp. KACC 21273]
MDYNSQNNGYPPAQPDQRTGVLTFKDWMLTILLIIIPFVNIVMLFVWAFGANTNVSKANFAKAYLIWLAIGIVVSIIFSILFGSLMAATMSNMDRSGY